MANKDPTTRVAGYIERRMLSRYVGMKGDLRAAIFAVFKGVEGELLVMLGVEGGESFWMRAERRGESILVCRYYNIGWRRLKCFTTVLQLGAGSDVMRKTDCCFWEARGKQN